MEQLKTIGRELAMGSQGGFGQSKEFLDLVKSIGEARSKAEEDRIVLNEIETLKRRLIEPDVPKRKMKEYIIRLAYVEMLGHDASFGYIHAVKMTHDDNLLLKRTGYLAVTLFLNEDHDLIILIVNTIQKDLKSDNYLVVCAALNAVCKLINEETIPAVLPQVVELLGHQKETVRKKAIMALHRFYRKSPFSVSHLISNFRKKLCDNDPGVMGATLCPLFDLITADVSSYKDLVSSFVSILKQVAEKRLPKSYDYHQMPAPFIQIKLLKILALLGSGDRNASEMMYTVIGDLFRKCDSSTNIGNAILYECICCVSSIHPNPKLLEAAADVISRFLKSDSHNLKYMGIDGLGKLIKISPDIAEQHQLAVIDCLEDPDDTLKRKTFELLYKMTKSSNVEVIVDRMIDYMISINDNHYKTEIASRCVELAEQFAPSNQWFIQTMNKVFEHAGDLVNIKVAHNLMRLIAEGFGEDDDDADSKLRLSAVESYLGIISEPKLPSLFLQVICWVLGEYGTADGKYSASYITGKLCDVAESYSSDETVKGYAVSALVKIYAFEMASGRKVDVLPECQSLIEELLASHSTDLQQRAYELQAVLTLDARAVECVMPLDASCEDIEVDKDLSFLNGYIQQAIESGAQPYISDSERSAVFNIGDFHSRDHHEVPSHALRFEAYELPKPAMPSAPQPVSSLSASTELVPVPEPSYNRESHPSISKSSVSAQSGSSEIKLRLDGVQRKWGQPTYSSASSSNPDSSTQTVNGSVSASHSDRADSTSSKPRSSYDSKKPEIDPEKQRLAASLFGGSSSRSQRSSSGGQKATKGNKTAVPKESPAPAPVQPPPDLLDMGEPTATVTSSDPLADPFKALEGLIEPGQDGTSTANTQTKAPDLMGLYSDGPVTGQVTSVDTLLSELSDPVSKSSSGGNSRAQFSKGPNLKEALEKDTLVRQMGVNPTSQNPNLFKDLLG
ncbi:PREDICTED: AP-4 complex subunit epsilon-like [Tarenaya hassleriana]|uniref:AP-4 complex subunit epsilon-like n=1 Tax=Tarenaya hassleriana TaxID=28532 RepID=UPI00053C8F89|nr:PREDICTED: AP-4 complex subunit epsilon-like [Tarenaya hassleriana]